MDKLIRNWLEPYDWPSVLEYLTRFRNVSPNALHGATYDRAHALWDETLPKKIPLKQALETCRQCHAWHPFGIADGDTFVLIAQTMVEPLKFTLSPTLAAMVNDVVKEFVASEIDEREMTQVLKVLAAKLPDNRFAQPSALLA